MPAANFKTQRFQHLLQVVLGFVSVCAVVDATHEWPPSDSRPAYHSSAPQSRELADRRFADLARTERQRREAEQRSSRRSAMQAGRHGVMSG